MAKYFSSFLLAFLFVNCGFGQNTTFSYVIDEAGIFTSHQIDSLNSMIAEIDRKSTTQICVYTINSLGAKNAREVATSKANAVGAGQKYVNNGILILIAPQDRELFMTTGAGTEWILPDDTAKIIVDSLLSYMYSGNYFGGATCAIGEIRKRMTTVDLGISGEILQGRMPAHADTKIFLTDGQVTMPEDWQKNIADHPQQQFFQDAFLKINARTFRLAYSKYMAEKLSACGDHCRLCVRVDEKEGILLLVLDAEPADE